MQVFLVECYKSDTNNFGYHYPANIKGIETKKAPKEPFSIDLTGF